MQLKFVETYAANANAPKASDVERWPASSGEAVDSQKRRDEVLASTLTKTESMILNLYQLLSQRMGQALMNTLRHPQFRVEDLLNATRAIVQLLWRLERHFTGKECVMVEYNLWMPGDGNQNLTLVVRGYLEVFREIMRDPRWKDQFDLVARAIFCNSWRRLIGPPCFAL